LYVRVAAGTTVPVQVHMVLFYNSAILIARSRLANTDMQRLKQLIKYAIRLVSFTLVEDLQKSI
jgi:hypothetical protein